jgi:thymidylate synthase (FAD)
MRYEPVVTPVQVSVVCSSGDDKTVIETTQVSRSKLSDRESAQDQSMIEEIARRGHMSAFEHCTVTFWIEAPIYIARQHMRHRSWCYNEVSRRYTSEKIRIYEPSGYKEQIEEIGAQLACEEHNPIMYITQGSTQAYVTKATEIVRRTNRQLVDTYYSMIEAGICREQARGVLPQSLMTQYYATVNLRNLVEFIKSRGGGDVQYEMRCLSREIHAASYTLFPISMNALLSR